MDSYSWYQTLVKPSWAPPSWLFGPVWTVLYIIIFCSFGFVLLQWSKKQIPFIVLLPFLLNILFNLLFTPLQFGLKSNLLAMFDIFLVLGTLLWAMWVIYPYFSWVTYVQIPYLLWVMFATVLQVTITLLNR